MLLHPVTAAEAEDLAALVNAAYRGPKSEQTWSTEADLIEGPRVTAPEVVADLADSRIHLLRVRQGEPDGPLLGCVKLEDEGDGVWMLGMLTVNPTLQAGGFGRRLLEAAEAYVHERGARLVRMTVITVREPLLAWYGRRGYSDTGARKPYAHPGARTRIPLEFAVLEKRL